MSIRLPDDLKSDVVGKAEMVTGRSAGDFIKEAVEFKLKLAWVIQADWYVLRQIDPATLRLHGPTILGSVIQSNQYEGS